MSVHEPHLVSVPLGDTGDQILNVAEGGTDHGGGLARAEPGVDLRVLYRNASFEKKKEDKISLHSKTIDQNDARCRQLKQRQLICVETTNQNNGF